MFAKVFTMESAPWRVSLHGGHSREFCDHATGSLREMIEAAAARGLQVYGLAEHAPRYAPEFLYPDEIAMGWDIAKLGRDFAAYAAASAALAQEFAGRITVLRGFEAEVVPADDYAGLMRGLRERFAFDYVVGSVHYVDELLFDYNQEAFDRVVARKGGIEPLAVAYYETVAGMAEALRPEVVGHVDIVRRFAGPHGGVDTPAVRRAAESALDAIAEVGAILDVNTGAYRKGDATPYPAPWMVGAARARGIPFCFGDDSHDPAHVGAHFDEARAYLLEHGVQRITTLDRQDGRIVRRAVPLD
ncbi:MAG: histidinol-phosphatase [Candidatus Hydrogenedentes bacterium]|nr:histidinol-phosphatase [Candidatus Hydrogenedentota bacterium]